MIERKNDKKKRIGAKKGVDEKERKLMKENGLIERKRKELIK